MTRAQHGRRLIALLAAMTAVFAVACGGVHSDSNVVASFTAGKAEATGQELQLIRGENEIRGQLPDGAFVMRTDGEQLEMFAEGPDGQPLQDERAREIVERVQAILAANGYEPELPGEEALPTTYGLAAVSEPGTGSIAMALAEGAVLVALCLGGTWYAGFLGGAACTLYVLVVSVADATWAQRIIKVVASFF